MPNILVIDDDKNILRLLEITLKRKGHVVSTYTDPIQGLAQAELIKPDLIIVDVMMPKMTGYEFCKQARSKSDLKEIPIIIFSARFQPIDKQTALDAGATEYLSKTTSPVELSERIAQLLGQQSQPHTQKQVAVGFFSLRGGTGVTSLSVNLALALSLIRKTNTALIDLAWLGGHTALMLGLRPTNNISQALSNLQSGVIDSITPHLTPHSSGVQLLASSHTYGNELSLADNRLEPLVSTLKDSFPFIVLDIPHILDPLFIPIMELLDKIILVISPDMPSLQSTALSLQGLLQHGIQESKIVLVVNHIIPHTPLSLQTIQKIVKRPIMVNIPFEPEMIKSVNSSRPLILTNPNSAGGTAIIKLAKIIIH